MLSSWIVQNNYHDLITCAPVYSFWHDCKLFWKNWRRKQFFQELNHLLNVNFLTVLYTSLDRARINRKTNCMNTLVTVLKFVSPSINCLGRLAWNQSSNMLKLWQCCLQRIHLQDTCVCSKQFLCSQHVDFFSDIQNGPQCNMWGIKTLATDKCPITCSCW